MSFRGEAEESPLQGGFFALFQNDISCITILLIGGFYYENFIRQ